MIRSLTASSIPSNVPEDSQDVLIVGGGVIGLCCGWYLSKAGYKVTILDRDPTRKSACSDENAGMVVPSHFIPVAAPGAISQGLKWMLDPESPFYIKPRLDRDLISWLWKFKRSCTHKHVERAVPVLREMHLNSLKRYEEFAESLDFSYVHRGSFYACNTESGLEHKIEDARIAGRAGIHTEVLGPEEIAKLIPETRLSAVGGVFYPDGIEREHIPPTLTGSRWLGWV